MVIKVQTLVSYDLISTRILFSSDRNSTPILVNRALFLRGPNRPVTRSELTKINKLRFELTRAELTKVRVDDVPISERTVHVSDAPQ